MMNGTRTARWALLLGCGVALILLVLLNPALEGQGEEDFLVYWSAARLLALGGDPYDPGTLRDLQERTLPDRERSAGIAFASWNPPWLLLALLPMGWLPFGLATRLWFLANMILIAGSVLLTWRVLLRQPDRGLGLALVASTLWGGSLMTLRIGQVSSLVCAALCLVLCFLEWERDLLAGALLLFCLIKPHVVFLVLPVIGLWTLRNRRWRVLVGGAAFGLASILALLTISPGAWRSYFNLVTHHAFGQYSTSTLGSLFDLEFGIPVLRYAGVLLLVLIPWLLRLAERRGLLVASNTAILVSLPLAPYGFGFDQIVLVPAIADSVRHLYSCELSATRRWITVAGLLLTYVVLFLQMLQPETPYHHFAWAPIALGFWYFTLVFWKPGTVSSEGPANFVH